MQYIKFAWMKHLVFWSLNVFFLFYHIFPNIFFKVKLKIGNLISLSGFQELPSIKMSAWDSVVKKNNLKSVNKEFTFPYLIGCPSVSSNDASGQAVHCQDGCCRHLWRYSVFKSFASLHFFFKMYEVGEVEGFLFIHFLKLDWITGIKIKFKPQWFLTLLVYYFARFGVFWRAGIYRGDRHTWPPQVSRKIISIEVPSAFSLINKIHKHNGINLRQ